MDAVEAVYDRLDAERNKGPRADPKKIEAILMELEAAMEKADSYVEPNEYDRVAESNVAAWIWESPAPAKIRPTTITVSRRTASNCGSCWNRSASIVRCSANSTKSAT